MSRPRALRVNVRRDALRRVGSRLLEINATHRNAEARGTRSQAERGNEIVEFA